MASDGAIYWQRVWGGGLLKSTDQGKTWKQISRAVKDNPIELPDHRLAGLAGAQIMVSADGGVTWTKLGPPAPIKPNGIIYSDKGKCFYAWRMSDNMKREKQSIVRLDVNSVLMFCWANVAPDCVLSLGTGSSVSTPVSS